MDDTKIDDLRFAHGGEVLEQHEYAKGLYAAANQKADEVERVWKAEYDIRADQADAGPVTVTRPAKAMAIVDKFRRLLNVRATVEVNVIPQASGEKEQSACTKLERWLEGYTRAVRYETKRDFDRDAAFWFLFRGRACYEVRFRPEHLRTASLPFQTIVDDPRYIYTVRGRGGILYYTKEYEMYVRELRGDLARKGGRYTGDRRDNEKVRVVEYMDDAHYAAVVDDDLVLNNAHRYGFVPISEAHCLDTPLASMEWAYQSVLRPVLDSLTMQYTLAAKMATGVNLFYYPLLFYKSANNTPVIVDPYSPGELQPMAPDGKIEVVPITVNHQVMAQLFGWYQSDINLMTLPETAFGMEPQSLQSGFAVAQVLGQVMDTVKDKTPQLERAMADHRGNILRLVERFGAVEGAKLSVPAYTGEWD